MSISARQDVSNEMKLESVRRIWCVLTILGWSEANSVFAQQALRGPAVSETDLVTSGQFTRTFKVNPTALLQAAIDSGKINGPVESHSLQERLRDYLHASGIDFAGPRPPLFFNERTGLLTVQGTIAQLEAVESALQALTSKPAQVAIEVRMMETTSNVGNVRVNMLLPQLQSEEFVLPSALPVETPKERNPAIWTDVLTQAAFSKILRSAEQSEGIDVLSVAKTVTTSGRQARIAVEDSSETVIDPPMHGARRIKLNAE